MWMSETLDTLFAQDLIKTNCGNETIQVNAYYVLFAYCKQFIKYYIFFASSPYLEGEIHYNDRRNFKHF